MYPVADKLPNEIERAAFVEALALIGTDQQDEFYAFCEIGKLISGYSKTMVSLIDSTHQCVLSGISLEPDADRSWPVEKSFCQHILADLEPTIVYDISEHPVFGKHPNVVSGKMTGSYCGFPIRTSDNLVLGTYCLGNDTPKAMSTEVVSAVDNMVTKLGAYLQRQSNIQRDNSHKMLLGLKHAQEHYPELRLQDLILLIEFRNGNVKAANELKPLKKLELISKHDKLTDSGAELLDKLNLYDTSFASRKIDFTDQAAAFDALDLLPLLKLETPSCKSATICAYTSSKDLLVKRVSLSSATTTAVTKGTSPYKRTKLKYA